jgi:phosphonate metabolism-associated iron-containing alcohol dehydrogenase
MGKNGKSSLYYNPVKIHMGVDTYLDFLRDILSDGYENIGLFYGHKSMRDLGAIEDIKDCINGYTIYDHSNINPNPEVASIRQFVSSKNTKYDLIIAIGGGSVIDFAKSVALLSKQGQKVEPYIEGTATDIEPAIPLIAIPTTSGSGSEVTPWATIWDGQKKRKFSLRHVSLFPKYAIVDPLLTSSLPPFITAYTAFDALSHALEAFWSKQSNTISDLYALKSIQLIINNLSSLLNNLYNIHLRSKIALASLYAGLAFSNTATTIVHAVSYPMTINYDIPHGVACSLVLDELLLFNAKFITQEKIEQLLSAGSCEDVDELKEKIAKLRSESNMPASLRAAGIPREGIQVILDGSYYPDRLMNNPRTITKNQLQAILESIYD